MKSDNDALRKDSLCKESEWVQFLLERDGSAKVRRAAMDAWVRLNGISYPIDDADVHIANGQLSNSAEVLQCLLERSRDRCFSERTMSRLAGMMNAIEAEFFLDFGAR